MKPLIVLFLVVGLWACPVDAQEVANSRAEIANQRIAAEVEMRRRAEEAAREAGASTDQQTQDVAPQTPPAPPPARATAAPPTAETPARSRADMSRTLQQIRTLGELRDAGYVTDAEFQRIKQRILEGEL